MHTGENMEGISVSNTAHMAQRATLRADSVTHSFEPVEPKDEVYFKDASTFVRGHKQGMRDRGKCERMPKSCLFSVHRTSERASIPLVIRWLPESV